MIHKRKYHEIFFEMTLLYFSSKVFRVKTYAVLMKNYSVSCRLANGSSFRKISSLGRMMF